MATPAQRRHEGQPATPDPDRYEYRLLTFPRTTSRAEARRLLTEHADYGRWELDRVRLTFGGVRRVRLRRKIIRVVRTA
ncbi:DUF5703 family protein [Kineococcus xinjiangensis]|nr:DUF5703 family protein [Kineococcus xinjiangensis]